MGVLKKVVKKYPNGNIHEEYTTNECGDKFGEYKEFDMNGKCKTLYYYEDDVMKRHCIDFYENGNKEYETIYYGTDISFRTFIHYYENGQIETSTDMLDDDYHGQYLEYYENGTLKEDTQYRNYYKWGISKKWHSNGKLEVEEVYGLYEKLNGTRKEWDYQGKLIKEENYLDGRLVK